MSNIRILMVVSNPTIATTTGWPVGFWASELIHPYDAFKNKGFSILIASPDGGSVEIDDYSNPEHESGYSRDDELSRRYLQDAEFTQLMKNTPSVSGLNHDDFDAIVIAGGQGPMFTFQDALPLHNLFLDFVGANKITAALCHGVSILFYLKNEDGSPFVKGKKITGFTNAEEDDVDDSVGQKVSPYRIQDKAIELGAIFKEEPKYTAHAVQDENLITGQQQNSGRATAELVINALL